MNGAIVKSVIINDIWVGDLQMGQCAVVKGGNAGYSVGIGDVVMRSENRLVYVNTRTYGTDSISTMPKSFMVQVLPAGTMIELK